MSENLARGSSQHGSGTNTPMMDSSCEFVNIGEDEIQDARENTQQAAATNANEGQDQVTSPTDAAALEAEAHKDEELRHLMGILQERVKSGSPSHSQVSTDSDFIHLPAAEREPEEMMDLSASSSAGSRFNIIVNRDPNQFDHSDGEEEVIGVVGEDALPDVDDRVESDIVVPAPEARPEPVDEVSLAAPAVRHYRHSPNRHLNTLLTTISLTALGFAVGIAIGHGIGSSREAALQREIQEGQKLRLRSIQDDLLMCLRKQEDIDQTINKLNEIENILVDAEHWRNEYEELLNIKLENEEKWRVERNELKASLRTVEMDINRLVHSKSCAHDNEYLSRQETTLKSVHEKLEASLSDKDLQIEKLQAEVMELKVGLMTADQMASSYRKSNEDKSLLILGLKEQLLVMEREMFDLKINSEEQGEEQVDKQVEDRTISTAEGTADGTSESTVEGTPVCIPESTAEGTADGSDGGEVDTVDKALVKPVDEAVELSPNAAADTPADAAAGTAEAAVLEVVGAETEVTGSEQLSGTASDVSTEIDKGGSTTTSIEGASDTHLVLDSETEAALIDIDTTTPQYSPEDNHQSVGGLLNTISQLQDEIFSLQLQIRRYETQQSILNESSYNSTNSTESQCVVFNLCDYLSVNISHDHLMQAYQATKGQYDNLQSFLVGEWTNLARQYKTDNGTSAKSTSTEPIWKQYMNQTKSAVSEFLDTMNNTWQDISNLSQSVVKKKIAKKTTKIQAKLSNMATVISRGVGVVKEKLASVFDGKLQHTDSWRKGKDRSEPSAQEEGLKQQKEQRQHITKMRRSLFMLTAEVMKMDKDLFNAMARSSRVEMRNSFSYLSEQYTQQFPDKNSERTYIDCQAVWWTQMIDGSPLVEEAKYDAKCSSSLEQWQLSQVNGSEQLKSNPHHQTPNSQDSVASSMPTIPADEQREGKYKRKFRKRYTDLGAHLAQLNMALVRKMNRREKRDIYERFDDFRDDFSNILRQHEEAKKWANCQCGWWKRMFKEKPFDNLDYYTYCVDNLEGWQQSVFPQEVVEKQRVSSQTADGTWQFERAENRKYHRDEPDDWYWRRSHDYEPLPKDLKTIEVPFAKDEL